MKDYWLSFDIISMDSISRDNLISFSLALNL